MNEFIFDSNYPSLVPKVSLQSPTNRNENKGGTSPVKDFQTEYQIEEEEAKIKDEYIKTLISSTIGELDKNFAGNSSPQKNLQETQGNFGGLNTTQNILIKEYEQVLNTEMNETLGATGMTRGLASLVQVAVPKEELKSPPAAQKSAPKQQDSYKSRRSNVNSPISEESESIMTRSKSKADDNIPLKRYTFICY
jgi:hypothetical protein